jgi:enoyl-CoA hydratase/carnithine racemase
MKHLLGFPIPVIAAINGHCFAAGFALAMACDYRVMKASKAWLSMNELLFGGPIPHSFSALFNAKALDLSIVRKVCYVLLTILGLPCSNFDRSF